MNRLKTLLAAMSLAVPSLIWAVPADPRLRTATNPDGSTVEYRVHGDERFHVITDAACTQIMHRNAAGYLENTLRNGKPLAFNQENVGMLRAEALANSQNPEFINYTPGVQQNAPSSMQRMATLNADGRSTYPTIGNGTRSLVVLVEFQDVEFYVENPKDYFTRQLNEPGFSDYGGRGSALDYFSDVSHGLYTPRFDVYGPVKVSHNAAYYEDSNNGHMASLIREAITELHESGELNLADYDYDENGTLDTVFIYYAGYGSADSETNTIWPHQYDYQYYVQWLGASQLRLDGVKVGPYACANELKGWDPRTGKQSWADGSEPWVDGIGTFCHEYGHVLGLPDLYDVEYSGNVVTPGNWDVMDQGSYNFDGCMPPGYSAYEQWVCNWLEYTDAENGTHYDLKALGNSDTPQAVRIRIPKTSDLSSFYDEYFVVETRDNSKWDSCFPDPGVMIWRINYKKSTWTNNQVNSKKGSNVEIQYADGDKHPIYVGGNIYPGAPNELKPSKTYQYWESPYIMSIAYDPETLTGSFDYNMITEPPTGAPLLHDNPYADTGTAKNFTLTWDPVEGADSYQVTIKRVSNGKIFGVYDEFNVGNVTSHKVMSVAIGFWNNEIEAYVRAVKGIPCSDTSNVITFVPKDLPKGKPNDPGAVDGVATDDVQISGGIGCVIAPAGAVVRNLSGQQLRNENLTPGIYLVSYGNETVKVVVR